MGAPFKFKTMENLDNNTCLYLHIKPESKEVFYVGIGTSKRPHKKSGRSRWWRGVVNKYGYEVIILADDLSWNDACKKEIYLINYYGRRDSGKGTLVNMTDGGDGSKGVIISEETRAKLSAAHKGKKISDEHKAKLSAANTGKVMSEETRAKIGAFNKGKKRSAEARAKMSAAQKGNKSCLGRKLSKETKSKISAAAKGRVVSAETRVRNAAANTGELSNTSKLTEYQVIEILIELRDNPYYGQNVDLSEKYGVDRSTMSSIKRNKIWKHICRETLTIR